MTEVSIKNIKLFEVLDENAQIYYGGWQEWYGAWWKRMSGCGPTVVSNIMSYISRSRAGTENESAPLSKSGFLELMEDVWQYVTPGMQGIPSTAALKKGVLAYIASKQLDILPEELDIPKKQIYRPAFSDLLAFIGDSLRNDAPVAFLSLDKGDEPLLDTWHWVTILALQYAEDGSVAFADVADEGKLLHVDLKKWFDTTKLGGGFVRFVKK
ncbi:MAG: hypothetical protein GX847_03840 [Clostridiales bacterium]|nr:hypothetical protein [Clostridiales bacterium]